VRRADGTEITVPRRRLALLLSVAVAGSRGVSREKLLGLLWPELDDERGRAALSQGLYALRKDLGNEEAITGTTDLRIDPTLVSSDRADFIRAIDEGADEQAVMLYRGPYLDGFYIREAPAFEQQLEEERQHLNSRYTAALERLARREGERGDHAAAVRLWRQRASIDPTDATIAVALMRAQAAGGDKAGALRHAEVYAELLRNSADLPPDAAVLACAAEIRKGPATAIRRPLSDGPKQMSAPSQGTRPGHEASDSRYRIALISLGIVGALFLIARFLPVRWFRSSDVPRVVAVTRFQDFAGDSLSGPLAELLRTSLANIPGLDVISLGVGEATGATEVIDGALYRQPDGRLRFDLRRVDAADGKVREAFTLDGADVFALSTAATRRLTERYGVPAPDGDLTTVSSSSLTAIRLYQAAHDANYRGDLRAAYNLFKDAAREDTTFAMAELYAGWTAPNDEERTERFERAHRLGLAASLREHLIIDVTRADFHSTPGTVALAESLVTLFPREMSGHFALGRARLFQEGDWLGAAKVYRDALQYDSVGFIAVGRKCDACVLHSGLFTTWMFADSFPAARRVAETWTRRIPGDPGAWRFLALVAVLSGDTATWRSARATVEGLGFVDDRFSARFYSALYLGDLSRADAAMRAWTAATPPTEQGELHWIRAQLRREQGRPRAAMAEMLEWRKAQGRLPYEAVFQAQSYFDAGEYARAAALWDSTGHLGSPVASRAARGWTWAHALKANALAALGDTAALLPIADTMRQRSLGSGFIRDRRLEHHVRGLYWAARGDDAQALSEFRASIWTPTAGLTRTDLELGRLLLRMGQPRDAALICASGLRGEMSASALYVSRGELHECAGRAWLIAGVRDSARYHLGIAAAQWVDPEPAWLARRDSVRVLLGRLGG
jgi:DNA-binding SARP family transcriptional activator